METVLRAKNMTKIYGMGSKQPFTALENIDLEIKTGEFIVVMGPSGSGKSTFLRSLNLLEEPTDGEIIFNGVDITKKKYKDASGKTVKLNIDDLRQKMGMVFQHFNLFPHMTILDNMTLAPMKVKGVSKEDAEKKALELLARVGLADRANAYPIQLSGGQRQALTLLMATLKKPRLLLLDEHTAALDPKTAAKVLETTDTIVNSEHLTTLMITHNMRDAIAHGNRLIMMSDGKIIYDVKGEEKKKLKVADLLQKFEEASGGEFANDRMLLS